MITSAAMDAELARASGTRARPHIAVTDFKGRAKQFIEWARRRKARSVAHTHEITTIRIELVVGVHSHPYAAMLLTRSSERDGHLRPAWHR